MDDFRIKYFFMFSCDSILNKLIENFINILRLSGESFKMCAVEKVHSGVNFSVSSCFRTDCNAYSSYDSRNLNLKYIPKDPHIA